MRLVFLFYFFVLIINSGAAEKLKGRVVSDADASLLPDVVVQNLKSSAFHTMTNESGLYEIDVNLGDSVSFSLLGYNSRTLVYNGFNEGWFSWVAIQPKGIVIDTVVVSRGLSKFQLDSLKLRSIYGKKVDYVPKKFSFHLEDQKMGQPMVFRAPITSIYEKYNKEFRRLKKFQQRFKEAERQSFIDTRYDATSVTFLTGLTGDSLYLFIFEHPIAYDYARTATDMEIKMWIKYNYREWIKKPIVLPPPIVIPNTDSAALKKP